MKKHFLSFAFLILSIQTFFTQTLSPFVKPHSGFDYAKLALIDTVLNEYVRKNWLAGAVTIIVKDNQLIQYKGYGFSDIETKKTMPSDAIFRIASQTKAITSLAILQLFEKGKLSLDQKISDFIPEFKNPKVVKTFKASDSSYTTVAAKREITFRDLLTHVSGIDYASIGSKTMTAIYAKEGIPSGLGAFNEDLLTKMKALAKLPLLHQPGEKFTYGLNTDVLGCLVEVISGKTLEAYFNENIFEPLGMKDSYFNVPEEKANRLTTVHTENEDKKFVAWHPEQKNTDQNYPLIPKKYFSGGAGLSTTAFDYAVFLQMLLNGGSYNNKQILGRRTTELMLSPQLDSTMFGNDNFSLGFLITSDRSAKFNMRSAGSFSWGGYFGTTYWADPKEKLVCLIMTQNRSISHYQFQQKIENIIYGSLK